MTSLVVVSSGLRAPSSTSMLAGRLAEAAQRELPAPVEVTSIELREHAHGIADALLSGFPAQELTTVLGAVQGGDALIVVTPTFQGSYAGLFKSFIDLIEPGSLRYKPVLLAATGGTERHSLVIEHALRPLFSYLGATTAPTGVYAATADFGTDTMVLEQRIRRAASELAVLARLDCALATGADEDPLAQAQRNLSQGSGQQFTDFGELLRSLGQE